MAGHKQWFNIISDTCKRLMGRLRTFHVLLAHVVTDVGLKKTFFIGFDVPPGNTALSYQNATQSIVEEILPWNELLSCV
ncbi:hypothetical protein Bhyg_07025 [Pseudolycoriella hygida]|uniref:Uncharacterized protein n=1 Tax=Pseudolycoriella hygida TaxID=35572 RepID=A0A9Q0N1X0_9DIPT|nr:hypothetical protein Bhyg_07025 [Pseudolycoriella hygida]